MTNYISELQIELLSDASAEILSQKAKQITNRTNLVDSLKSLCDDN